MVRERFFRPRLRVASDDEPNARLLNRCVGPLTRAVRQKLQRAGRRSGCRLRKQFVEPVFGQIKQAMGFRRFRLRGIDKVKAEWALVCAARNFIKLARPA